MFCVSAGIYLRLKGRTNFTNGIIPITVIGQTTNEASHPDLDDDEREYNDLQCVTDERPCCRVGNDIRNFKGEWYFPNNETVPIFGSRGNESSTFYRNRGNNDGTVILNRIRSDIMSPTGRFCCVIPDSSNIDQTICANITIVNVTIMSSSLDSSVAGENFTLHCSVLGAGDFLTQLEWLNLEHIRGISIFSRTTSSSQLQFAPLQASHNGVYTCQAIVEDNMVTEKSYTVYVKLPAPESVTVTHSIQSVGHEAIAVTLICTVELSPTVDVPVTVNTVWTGPAGFMTTNTIIMGNITTYTSRTTISSHERDESGVYTCTAAINSTSTFLIDSDLLFGTISITTTAPQNFIAIPDSTSVMFSWFTPLYPRAVTNYTLTCTSLVVGADPLIMTYIEAGSYTMGGFRPATAYSCSVFASSVIGSSALSIVNITTVDESLQFQLWLMEVDNCAEWMVADADQKLNSISSAVVDNIENLCQCGFIQDRVTDEMFQCIEAAQEIVIYTATIHGTASISSSELILHVKQWAADGAVVTILDEVLNISYTDLAAEECCTEVIISKQEINASLDDIRTKDNNLMITSSLNETQAKDNDRLMLIIIGASSAAAVLAIVIITIVIIAALVNYKHRKHGKIRIHKKECVKGKKDVDRYENICASRVQEGVYIEESDYGEIKGQQLQEDYDNITHHLFNSEETQFTQDNESEYSNIMKSHHHQSQDNTCQHTVSLQNELAEEYHGKKSHQQSVSAKHYTPREGCDEMNEEVYDDIKPHQPRAKNSHDPQQPEATRNYVTDQFDGKKDYDSSAIAQSCATATRYQPLLSREGEDQYENNLEDYSSINNASQSQDASQCKEYDYVATKPRYYYRPSMKY